MLPVQEFLLTNSFGELIAKHGVYASPSKDRRVVSINYDQIETKDSDWLAWDCRGLILAKIDGSEFQFNSSNKLDLDCVVGDTQILAYPMRRFFNYGQEFCSKIEWSDNRLSIQIKSDGTLIIVYFNKLTNKWAAATRKVPEADLLMDNKIYTFRTLFEMALFETCQLTFDQFTNLLNKNYTYCFELCSKLNQIVVDYPKPQVVFLAVRDLTNLQEIDPLDFKDIIPVPQPHTYAHASVEDLVNLVATFNPTEHEGFVVRDSNFRRLKIKSPAHGLASKMRDSLFSERNCMELILLGKEDDVLAMDFLPKEITNNIVKIKTGLQKVIKVYDETYKSMRVMAGSKKDFALLIKEVKGIWGSPLYAIFDGKASNVCDFIEQNRKMGTWGDSFLDKMLQLSKSA